MGRTEPSHAPLAQQSHRKDQRAKHARLTINKTIPNLLKTIYRARQGILHAELIVDPQVTQPMGSSLKQEVLKPESKATSGSKKKRGKKGRDDDQDNNDQVPIPVPSVKKSRSDDLGPILYKIQVADTLQAAQMLHSQLPKKPKIPNQNIAVLNMASPLRPGGGVLNGATSQEESLCIRTTLLSTLREEWYRLPEVGGAWSPDVCVFRVPTIEGTDQELGRRDRFYVDVISAGMLRFPEVVIKTATVPEGEVDDVEDGDDLAETEKVYVNDADREMVLKKIRGVMRILQAKGAERVVLGAWGCGAYGNPVGEIVTLWKKVLFGRGRRGKNKDPEVLGSQWKPLKEIVFAIKDRKMAEEFAKSWGDDIAIEYGAVRERISTVGGNEVEKRHLEELKEKIRVLESQLEQVKTPLLRQGVENALATLQGQLEEAGSDSGFTNESVSGDGAHLTGASTGSEEDEEEMEEFEEEFEDDE